MFLPIISAYNSPEFPHSYSSLWELIISCNSLLPSPRIWGYIQRSHTVPTGGLGKLNPLVEQSQMSSTAVVGCASLLTHQSLPLPGLPPGPSPDPAPSPHQTFSPCPSPGLTPLLCSTQLPLKRWPLVSPLSLDYFSLWIPGLLPTLFFINYTISLQCPQASSCFSSVTPSIFQ